MALRIIRPDSAFSRDKQRKPRVHNEGHLAWIRTLPCVVTGRRILIEAAHIRFGSLVHGKASSGAGMKPDDQWVLPLCHELHTGSNEAQHSGNEQAFWLRHHIDPITTAALLYANSGNEEAAMRILDAARTGALFRKIEAMTRRDGP